MSALTVHTHEVKIPAGSTIGYGYGVDDSGRRVSYCGDWRMMRCIGEAIADELAPVPCEVEPYQIMAIGEKLTSVGRAAAKDLSR